MCCKHRLRWAIDEKGRPFKDRTFTPPEHMKFIRGKRQGIIMTFTFSNIFAVSLGVALYTLKGIMSQQRFNALLLGSALHLGITVFLSYRSWVLTLWFRSLGAGPWHNCYWVHFMNHFMNQHWLCYQTILISETVEDTRQYLVQSSGATCLWSGVRPVDAHCIYIRALSLSYFFSCNFARQT